jgi:hypothetical protein
MHATPPPTAALASLDALAGWRRTLDRGVERVLALLGEYGLLDTQAQALGQGLRLRLASDRLVLAFVAEFSRGKSELINALFFADTGRRVLPATPGRTTMCPVELAWDSQQPPMLSLLPIATRSGGQTLAALREQPAAWQRLPLPVDDADALAQALEQVVRTQQVPLDEARALGFWSDEQPDDNPPRDAQGRVELPAWRHALINYPHPLLKRGLVVLDTPGLNAIGAEPELTLALLPSAHAAVFVLAADTGVTRSDLAVWRDHLGERGIERFVVLNKIDTLEDPLLDAAQIESQVRTQCALSAQTLGVPPERVFALSARRALSARVAGDTAALAASRLPVFEQALLAQLLPQRSQVIARMVEDVLAALQHTALRRLDDRRRENADQLAELGSLRGKSAARQQLMSARLEGEAAEFERCAPRLLALRSVLARQVQTLLDSLSGECVRAAVRRMREGREASFLKLGAARAFAALRQQLQGRLAEAEQRLIEIEQMLQASALPLNAEFGFALSQPPRPVLERFQRELARIDAGYGRYLGITQVWRLAQAEFAERFSRLLLSRLGLVFEAASHEIEAWAQSVGAQIDEQLRERRRALAQRRESHARIRQAEDGLERSIVGLAAQALQLQRLADGLAAQLDGLRVLAASPPPLQVAAAPALDAAPRAPRLQLVAGSATPPARGAA